LGVYLEAWLWFEKSTTLPLGYKIQGDFRVVDLGRFEMEKSAVLSLLYFILLEVLYRLILFLASPKQKAELLYPLSEL
jgi:hypothetical protein